MDLSADVSGLIPSDRNTERGFMGCLIVHPHCFDLMSRLPQTRFPLLTLRDLLGFSGSRVNRVQTARIENGRVENGRAMDGRRGAPGFRVTRGACRSVQPDNKWSNWTTGPVHVDRTDTPNLALTKFCPVSGAERSTNPAGFRADWPADSQQNHSAHTRFAPKNRGGIAT